jgi:hypothetical protein
MSASSPTAWAAMNVVLALQAGLLCKKTSTGWAFAGPGNERGVRDEVVAYLLAEGSARKTGDRLVLTLFGLNYFEGGAYGYTPNFEKTEESGNSDGEDDQGLRE